MINSKLLLKKIKDVFPIVEMPPKENIIRSSGSRYFDGLLADIEPYRGCNVSVDLIRLLHQELSRLSSEALLWILPNYLEYCLSSEAEYSQMEIEFLIYAFSPLPEFKEEVLDRFSFLSSSQISCLIDFFKWCQSNNYWQDRFRSELSQSIDFLVQLAGRGSTSCSDWSCSQ